MKPIVDSLKVLGESTKMFESLRDHLFKPKELKFNSQICTTREQSERLLSLGLRKETADMALVENWDWSEEDGKYFTGEYFERPIDYVEGLKDRWIPAWSLHRLIEMMPNCIPSQGWLSFGHQGLHYSKGYGVADDGLYESIIRMFEWLIKEGYFNKEYLVDFMGTDSHQDMVDSFRYAFESLKKEE